MLCRVAALVALACASSALAARNEPPIPDEIVRMKVESATYHAEKHELEVRLEAEIAEGWHVNAHQPRSKTLIPTTLAVTPPPGYEVGEIQYPEPQTVKLEFARDEPLDVYSGRVVFGIPLSVKTDFSADEAGFRAKLHYQACDDTRCLRPADVERTFFVKQPTAATAMGAATASNQAPVEQWLAERGLATTLVLVFVMGLGLNLTPCVYPLISVTIAYFGGQQRGRRGHTALLAASYALGIAITFSVLGVAAALSGGLFGRALQDPRVLVGIAILMIALAASSFGLYSLQPPASLLRRVGGSTPGTVGALLMGLTMGVVAAPCVGPIVVGLLVAVGARADMLLGFLLFFTLALGLGAPYVLLAMAAGSIARLPRGGDWLIWVERLFGFVLLGLALYFVKPLLSAESFGVGAAALLVMASLWLGVFDRSGSTTVIAMKRAMGVLGLAVAVWIAIPAGETYEDGIRWQPFSPAELETARQKQRPAVVDFRADWCLPCIEMERTTFVAPEVKAQAERFTMLRADVTEMTKESEQMLSQYGVLGVPTTIFFTADGTERERMVGYIAPEEFTQILERTGSEKTRGPLGAAG